MATRSTPRPRRSALALPWRDRAGRFSTFKAVAFGLTLLPALVMAVQWSTGQFVGRPVMDEVHYAGLWTIRFLAITLAVTPLRVLADWPRVVLLRRMLGLTAMCYAIAHLSLYIVDENYRALTVASEIIHRFYLTIGFATLCGLVVLGITSTDGSVRRLGRNWKRLHRVLYLLIAVATLHFFIQSKANVSEAVLMAGIFLWLLLWRVLPKSWQANFFALLALAPVAAVGTAMMEYAWYDTATHINPMRVLMANFNLFLPFGPRPAVWILGGGIAIAVLTGLRRLVPRLLRPATPVRVPAPARDLG
jgi:methionine sulfoxide reductase heme-binding subunit